MTTYLFNLGIIVVSIEAPDKLTACEKFTEQGYDSSSIVSIDKDLGGVF